MAPSLDLIFHLLGEGFGQGIGLFLRLLRILRGIAPRLLAITLVLTTCLIRLAGQKLQFGLGQIDGPAASRYQSAWAQGDRA